MYKKYPCTHLYRVATYKMCTAGIHLFAQSPSRTAALRPPYSSPEDQRRRWQCNRFCSNPAWRQSSELGYPGKDNHKLIAKIRFYCSQRTVQRSCKRTSLGFFVLRRRQTSGVVAVQGKQNWFLASVADGYTHPAVVIRRYDKCEKYNEQHQNEK